MKKLLLALALLVAGFYQFYPAGTPAVALQAEQRSGASVADAYAQQKSDVQVSGSGTVTRILKDDHHGNRHQRFILRLEGGLTLLVAHNIDLAPRIDSLKVGDTVGFYGEYEWNNKGGVLHWTHHDPAGRHPGGWLKHLDRTYQ